MFHYFEDKEFLNKAYSFCADIVNQTKMLLKKEDIDVDMFIQGSKRRNMITQNEEEPIDFDFDLFIKSCPDIYNCHAIKEAVRKCFNQVLQSKDLFDCEDSRSVLSSKEMGVDEEEQTLFSIDLAITTRFPNENFCRLIHERTGIISFDRWFWNEVPDSSKMYQRVETLKQKGSWQDVRECYLDKKNFYLTRNDQDHPSFICFNEAVNEVFYQSHN